MSISKKELIKIIEKISPPELMESWDNTGIQVESKNEIINKILVCLDICDDTVQEAIDGGFDFIVSHHPVIFSPLKSVQYNDSKGKLIIKLILNGISVYSAHTSFDKVYGGNNDYISKILGIEKFIIPEEEPIIRIGELKKPMTLENLCGIVKERITKGQVLSYNGELNSPIRKVGICTGAGASLMDVTAAKGGDALITGDVKYHDFQRADELGICVIDAGHFETEIFFGENMGNKLKKELGDRAVVEESKLQKNNLKRF